MSAYIVDNKHIDVIVSYCSGYGDSGAWVRLKNEYFYLNHQNAGRIAYELYKQNVLSVNSRYSNNNSDELYSFNYIPNTKNDYTIADIAKAIDSLEYQSCEHAGWEASDAKFILQQMRKHLLRSLKDYEESEAWHICDRKKEVTK